MQAATGGMPYVVVVGTVHGFGLQRGRGYGRRGRQGRLGQQVHVGVQRRPRWLGTFGLQEDRHGPGRAHGKDAPFLRPQEQRQQVDGARERQHAAPARVERGVGQRVRAVPHAQCAVIACLMVTQRWASSTASTRARRVPADRSLPASAAACRRWTAAGVQPVGINAGP